ncbi:MAG: hypothetical protein JW839_08865 [Candidatus Lokiarchaeota archaeon]|nr:hypothetical protein [Candidatus Lokiarchaeota archaeon]
MTDALLLYSASTCHRCDKLSDFLGKIGVQYTKVSVDKDGDLEAEALMLGICSLPALRKGGATLKTREIFTRDDQIIEVKVKQFLGIQGR